jgi:hypothetical protein
MSQDSLEMGFLMFNFNLQNTHVWSDDCMIHMQFDLPVINCQFSFNVWAGIVGDNLTEPRNRIESFKW